MNFPEQAATAADPIRSKRWGIAALVSLLLSVTLALQWGVGDLTLYSQAVEAKREALHFGILKNVPPEGKSWSDWGGFSVQRRIGVVYAAEAARQFTGQRIGKIYKVFDTVFLFLGLVALFAYLYCSVGVGWALLGVFYLIAVLPLTYHFALFHPWDRLQLLIWIGLLWLVQNRALVALSALLMLSVLVKPDAIFVPFLFLAMHWSESGAAQSARRISRSLDTYLGFIFLPWGLAFGSAWGLKNIGRNVGSNTAQFDYFSRYEFPFSPIARARIAVRTGTRWLENKQSQSTNQSCVCADYGCCVFRVLEFCRSPRAHDAACVGIARCFANYSTIAERLADRCPGQSSVKESRRCWVVSDPPR
jgi:hypothetical protein